MPMVVDADAVLATPVAFQRLERISGQGRQVFHRNRRFQSVGPDLCAALEAGKRLDPLTRGKFLCSFVAVTDDHLVSYRAIMLYVKRKSNHARHTGGGRPSSHCTNGRWKRAGRTTRS